MQDAHDMIPTWVDGRLTPFDKLEAHRRGLRHKAVSVFLIAGRETLLQQRAAGKYHTPGLWANACCTHPLWNEHPEDCAKRRLREELGVEGVSPQPRGQVEYRADVGEGLIEHELVSLFVAQVPRDLRLALSPEEVQAVEWVALDALEAKISAAPQIYSPWLRIYWSTYRDRILRDG